jgi:hypothetical protein
MRMTILVDAVMLLYSYSGKSLLMAKKGGKTPQILPNQINRAIYATLRYSTLLYATLLYATLQYCWWQLFDGKNRFGFRRLQETTIWAMSKYCRDIFVVFSINFRY